MQPVKPMCCHLQLYERHGNHMEHNHDHLVTLVRADLPPDNLLEDLTFLYKAFADKTRVKILFSLLNTELCVCAISEILGMEQSAISHQLKKLKECNLIDCRREGKTIIYYLADDHVKTLISVGFEHLLEQAFHK